MTKEAHGMKPTRSLLAALTVLMTVASLLQGCSRQAEFKPTDNAQQAALRKKKTD